MYANLWSAGFSSWWYSEKGLQAYRQRSSRVEHNRLTMRNISVYKVLRFKYWWVSLVNRVILSVLPECCIKYSLRYINPNRATFDSLWLKLDVFIFENICICQPFYTSGPKFLKLCLQQLVVCKLLERTWLDWFFCISVFTEAASIECTKGFGSSNTLIALTGPAGTEGCRWLRFTLLILVSIITSHLLLLLDPTQADLFCRFSFHWWSQPIACYMRG
jgi:hypothetical protein